MSTPSTKNYIKSTLVLPKLDIFCPEKILSKSYSVKKIKNKNFFSLSFLAKKKEKTKIIWAEGGKEIFLTGSFCNWNKFYLMKKDNKNEYFYYILDLPKDFHQFKFKVDGLWKNSSIYPKFNNNGNINNYYDNSSLFNNQNITTSTVESSLTSNAFNNNRINMKIINNNRINTNISNNNNKNNINIDFSYSKKNYCNYYPKINEMREYTDKKPCYFPNLTYQDINQIQNKIGNKNYLYLKKKIFIGNNSYKNIERKDHILLNHLCQRENNQKTFLINSITVRYRHKNSTFLYYK